MADEKSREESIVQRRNIGYESGLEMPLYTGKYNQEVYDKTRESLLETQEAPNFDENSVSILEMRYLRKDENKKPAESPKDLVARVASYIAYPDFVYSGGDNDIYISSAKKFYKMIAKREFMPNSPTLMNAGRSMGMLSACFVLPVEDSIKEIFEGVQTTAMIQKAGGGTGFTFDHLRPTGDYIYSSGGTTSGPISFWRVYAVTTDSIQQGAFRRGANMGMMSVTHPDILKFINVKKENPDFDNFNISVKVTDEWMNTLMSNPSSPLIVTNPRTNKRYYMPKNIDPLDYSINDLIPADEGKVNLLNCYTTAMLWENIVKNAHGFGDPGIAFIDRLNEDNPTPDIGPIEATNPCGEQPLLPYEACNLGSINLGLMVSEGKPDYENIKETTRNAVRFLDNVIDMNNFPDGRITEIVKGNRKIGLGIMGWAEMLAALKMRYDSKEALSLAEEVMKTIQEESIFETKKLAQERGAFPNFGKSIYANETPRRNATTTTIAPTGTIGLISGTSQGIEPFFGNAYSHMDAEGNIRKFRGPELEKALKQRNIDTKKVFEQLFNGKKLIEIEEVPRDIAEIYITSHEISIENQIAMQSAFQKYTENAVSKTINLVAESTPDDFDRAYRGAFVAGLKGITAYRNGSKKNQPIIFGGVPKEKKTLIGTIDNPVKVPEIMPAVRIRQDTPFGNMHGFLVFDSANNYRALEAFVLLGKSGDEESATMEALGRSASLHCRSGGSLEILIDQYIGIGSGTSTSTRSGQVNSLAMGFAKILLKFVVARNNYSLEELLMGEVDYDQFSEQVSDLIRKSEGNPGGMYNLLKGYVMSQDFLVKDTGFPQQIKNKKRKSRFNERCPDCKKGVLIHVEGCLICSNRCGFSRCG